MDRIIDFTDEELSYSMIPIRRWMLDMKKDLNLELSDILVYAVIANINQLLQLFNLSAKSTAEDLLHMSEKTVDRSFKKLRDLGLIDVVSKKPCHGGYINEYSITPAFRRYTYKKS
jgi:predicted transcriptional regulator